MNIDNWYNKYCVDSQLKYPSIATQKNYQSTVLGFLYFFKKEQEPQHIKTDKIKEWLLTFKTINTRNHKLCAIKSFYSITVGMSLKLDKIPFSRKEEKLPMPLSLEETSRLFKACKNKKHLAIMSLLFGCGMRVGEVLSLKPQQIDRSGMVIHIKNGKRNKDRFVPLDKAVLRVLEEYWREYKPDLYMFNGQYSTKIKPTQYTLSSINQFLKNIALEAKVNKNLHSHLGRHSYATQLLENGTDIGLIQNILGHKKQSTTLIYVKITSSRVSKIKSPIAEFI